MRFVRRHAGTIALALLFGQGVYRSFADRDWFSGFVLGAALVLALFALLEAAYPDEEPS